MTHSLFKRFGLSVILSVLMTNVFAMKKLDSIVAIVDEDVITQIEFDQNTRSIMLQLRTPVTSEEDMAALKKQVLEKMIRDKIQLQLAAKLGIQIDDIQLNKMLEKIAAANTISLDVLRKTLESDGINFSQFREQTREQLIIKQLQQRVVANKVKVSEQEIDQYIEKNTKLSKSNIKYHLRHILISTPETATPEQVQQAKVKAEELAQRIADGSNFEQIAVKESAGRNALKGGDLGWRTTSELPELFVKALTRLHNGDVTPPLRSASGFHLLQLVESTQQSNTVVQTLSRHILIRDGSELTTDPEAFLNDIRQRIEQGEDFATLAEKYSDDPGSKIKGGELGWADPGTFVPEFESTMQTLADKEISRPFKSKFGWHIMQVLGRREAEASHDTLAAKAKLEIRKRKIDEELTLWLRKIRDEAFIEYVDVANNE